MTCDNAYYDLLGVSSDASVAEVKRAFRRKALVVHPDRNPDPGAHAAFQRLRNVHDILVDPEKRALYDEGGEAAVADDSDQLAEDATFWANAFAKITKEDIEKYEQQYPGSADEKTDLADHYERFEGNVRNVVDYIPFSEATDLLRFIAVWDELIEDEQLTMYPAYKSARKNLEKMGKKAQKAAPKKSLRVQDQENKANTDETSSDALVALLQQRASQREKAFDAWAESIAERSRQHESQVSRSRAGKRTPKQTTSDEPTDQIETPSRRSRRSSNMRGAISKRKSKR